MTELALDTALSEEQRDYLEAVKTSGDALLVVINDILDFSKIEAGKLELNPIVLDLRRVLTERLEPLATAAGRKGVAFACRIEDRVPQSVVADPTRLCQVVTNLLGNALKFTERGEVALEVGCESQDENAVTLHFVVSDTGIGIPAHKQSLIFEAFSQADGSTTRRFGGTGLGLTISSRLVELMGGRIWVESAEGQGSRFHFTARVGVARQARLSASQGVEVSATRAGVRPHTASEQAVSILLAEDNEVNRILAMRLLERQGYRVVVAENGREAIAALDREQFDLVLMDVQMPEMDGLEAARAIRLRERETGGHLPIIALTSHAMKGDRERCLEAGMDDYVSKPIRTQDLFATIEAQLLASRSKKDLTSHLGEEALSAVAEPYSGVSRP